VNSEKVTLPAMPPFPEALPWVSTMEELKLWLELGYVLVRLPFLATDTAANPPRFRLRYQGQDTHRVGEAIASRAIGDRIVAAVSNTEGAELLFERTLKGRT
jgi:hypothetical protein